jgi:hypothetical protein
MAMRTEQEVRDMLAKIRMEPDYCETVVETLEWVLGEGVRDPLESLDVNGCPAATEEG